MNEKMTLIQALQHVDDLVVLLEHNDWKDYIYQHLTPVRYELERQLSLKYKK